MVHAISVHGTKFNPAPICSLEDKVGSDATRMPLDVCTDRDKSASQSGPCLPLFAPDHTTGIPYSVGLLNSMLVFNLNLMTGLSALQAPKPGTLPSSRDDGAAALDLNDP
ncbi:hypothetical protein [Mollivirus kamchatka]|nr:hypothetical protein [Mollivirus kamchatka]